MWTHRPEAAALLRSLAETPPRKVVRTYCFNEAETVFAGQRVAALRCHYLAAEPPIDTPEWREWLAWTPQKAIAAAIQFTPLSTFARDVGRLCGTGKQRRAA